MTQTSLRTILALAILTSLTALHGAALAKAERTAVYAFDKAWPTAVRFLRVDEGLKVIEKDPDTGYIIFELREEGKVFSGALELIRTTDKSRDAVQLVLRVEDRPNYTEQGMIDRLVRKLESELGRPVPPPSDKPAPAPKVPADDPPAKSTD